MTIRSPFAVRRSRRCCRGPLIVQLAVSSQPSRAVTRAQPAEGGNRGGHENKLCLCNGLLATVGLGQRRTLGDELPILTAGEGLREILAYLPAGKSSYSARNVMEQLVAR
jgi:hypothetical protein